MLKAIRFQRKKEKKKRTNVVTEDKIIAYKNTMIII